MEDGSYKYYTIQHRRTHESPWLQPDGPFEQVSYDGWSFSSWDHFGWIAEPWHGTGNDWRPKHKKSHDETHDVWSKTGSRGWWTLEYAMAAFHRLMKANDEGAFNSKDGYNKVCQALRFEFRIVVVETSRKVTELTLGHLLQSTSEA